jgi:hypothetical protein
VDDDEFVKIGLAHKILRVDHHEGDEQFFNVVHLNYDVVMEC